VHFGAVMEFDPLPERGAPGVDPGAGAPPERRCISCRATHAALTPARGTPVVGDLGFPAPRFNRRPRGHATLPAPGGDDELHEWFADFRSHRLDGRRPLWESVLLDGLAGGAGRW
jgi:hypothetical protein